MGNTEKQGKTGGARNSQLRRNQECDQEQGRVGRRKAAYKMGA